MKKFIFYFLIILSLSDYSKELSAQIPTYTLTARNLHLIAPDSLTFDIYLKSTNSAVLFRLGVGQFVLNYNPNFSNGGNLSIALLQSDLDTCRPQNISITTSRISFICSSPSISSCIISNTGLGSLVGKFSLKNTTEFLPLDSFKLSWASPPGLTTKIAVYNDNGVIIFITSPQTHYIDLLAGINNSFFSSLQNNFRLEQNYPNPFNPKTKISYELRVSNYVILKIFDVNGREVETLINEKQNVGYYRIEWDGRDYPSGVYFYRIQSDNFKEVKRMILIK